MSPIHLLVCLVVGVADGDTLTVRCGNPNQYRQVKIRLADIDSPEKKQPYGERSRQALVKMCHKKLALIEPQSRDRYGRTVGRVKCGVKKVNHSYLGGIDVNTEQVRTGMAWGYSKYVTRMSLFNLHKEAQRAKRGLWADKKPIAPWVWREAKRKKR